MWLRLPRVNAVGGRPQRMGQRAEAESTELSEGIPAA